MSKREPIAIIGIGCHFPGVRDVDSFWKVLSESRETVGDYPGRRFDYIDQVYAAESPFSDRIASRRGGFLPDLDRFDAEFFGISPREAALLDPQQRLLLEVAWEAVDDAGLVRERLAGSRTGVFVGVWTSDYEDCMYEYSPDVDFHATTGGGRYGASGRLAYFLDLRGPNLTLDTACSSSLVAIHLACQSLLAGESGIALAGGVNAILRPEITLVYSDAGMLAPDGRCKFGDASADGYVRSEGAGIVVLKPLSNALADGDPIYALIRGSAVNNDGQSSGLLVSPSPKGQEDVIRTALQSAGIHPDEVDYVEAHGTGTPTGDPVEIETIGRVMTSTTRRHPCGIGSVKTNIGHTESAAGVAGVTKVALALSRGVLPASLHFLQPSPRIAWHQLPLFVPTNTEPWPLRGHTPVAGVSGFGITGTNAHVVLEGVQQRSQRAIRTPESRPSLFLLSAHTQGALREVARSWRQRLEEDPQWPESLADLAYTAAVRRSQHEFRLTIIAKDRDELKGQLTAWIDGDERSGIVAGQRFAQLPSKAVFVFPGQGGQWIGMGRSLFERETVFRNALLRCDEALKKQTGWSVVEALLAEADTTRLGEIDVVQPTLFAVMFALSELWRSLGVEPAAVIGHSMGEVAAAAVAGALSLDDAATVICHRSRLMKRVSGHGLMAVVELSMDDTRSWLVTTERVWVAASNGANSTVVSGDAGAVEALLVALEAREIFCRRIQVDVASHSGHMDAVRDELEAALKHIQPRRGELPIYSTTTGEIEDGTRLDASYWGENLRQPVLFHPAVERLLADGFDAFVEVNAHPVLTHALTDSIQRSGRDAVVTESLRRNADEQVELLSGLGKLHSAGYPLDFRSLYSDGSCLRLPVYPWQRERHWFEPAEEPARHAEHSTRTRSGLNAARDERGSQDGSNSEQIDPTECLYELNWVDAPAVEPVLEGAANKHVSGHWIVLSDESIGPRLASELRALGDSCTLIRPGDSFKADELPAIIGDEIAHFRGVVHLWTVGDSPAEKPDLNTFWLAQQKGSYSIPGLVRSLAALNVTQSPQLWLVTAGVHQADAGDQPRGFAQGPLWGVGSVVAREHPEISCVNLDLSWDTSSHEEVRRMARLIKQGTAEEQLALRGERLRIARYLRANKSHATPAPKIHPDATYLVTGGLGGIGILTARWLADHGARHLVLTARRDPSEEALGHIADMQASGTSVRVIATDLSDTERVVKLIEGIADLPPLKGIFHLAVVTGDALLADTTTKHFEQVLSGKAGGAWNLYQSTRDLDLDFCVFFSSIATLIAQPGQGAYAAANGFLDSLARYCRTQNYPARSVQWGPWIGGGLSTQQGKQRSVRAYAEQGIRPMRPVLGFAILESSLCQTDPVVLAAVVDWRKYAEYCGDSQVPRILSELVPTPETRAGNTAHSAGTVVNLREELLAADAGRARQMLLENHLRKGLAHVLKLDPARIDVQKPVGSMGVDSLMAMEFVRRLSASAGIRLPATMVFNYPTIRSLTVEVARRMSVPLDRQVVAQEPASVSRPSDTGGTVGKAHTIVQELSEEEAIRSLLSSSGEAS